MEILFVEDDEIIASGLIYSFSQEGYAVTHFINVEQALAAIGEREFSLAILDLSLPDGSGYDICKALKAKGDTPVIFLTAVDDEGKDFFVSSGYRSFSEQQEIYQDSNGALIHRSRVNALH